MLESMFIISQQLLSTCLKSHNLLLNLKNLFTISRCGNRRFICNTIVSRYNGGSDHGSSFVLRALSTEATRVSYNSYTHAQSLVQDDLLALCDNIKQELSVETIELRDIARYHFDGRGKYIRPLIILLAARACNFQNIQRSGQLLSSQRKVAMIAEMIHTASLIHDDVIDASDVRRGKPTVHSRWGQRRATLTGDYILAAASMVLARIGNVDVIKILSKVFEDLVTGEFMQLGSKEDESERFGHYLRKTYLKTASLIANSCKAVAVLGGCDEHITEIIYQYGRNVGIAFQLIDDLLDFVSDESVIGKPAEADLKLGLATAPVLFAASQFPELNPLIMRRFSQQGDVQRARELVAKSEGVSQTRQMAVQHCNEAVRQLSHLHSCDETNALVDLSYIITNRTK